MSTPVIHPERAAAYARGDLAGRMVTAACELACLVRDEDAGSVGAYLDALSPDEARALLVVQAAMIPLDAAPAHLLAWVTWDEFGAPLDTRPYADCGTATAYWRHKQAGHPKERLEACGCAQAGREYFRDRHAARRGGQLAPRAPASRMGERMERYAELRRQGDSVAMAAGKLGIVTRTAYRYEARLKAAGRAA